MDTSDVTLNLKKGRTRCRRKASGLLYIKANDQSSTLHFKNGEVFQSGYNLKYYEDKLLCMQTFVRVHRSYLIMLAETDDYTYLTAIFPNNVKIPLNNYGYAIVKEFIDKRNSTPPSSFTAA